MKAIVKGWDPPAASGGAPSTDPSGERMTAVEGTIYEERLIRDTVNGDTRAWNLLVDRVYAQVWGVAVAELEHVPAREVCDLVLLRLAQRLHQFTDAKEAIDWARHDATDECRRARTKEQRVDPAQLREAADIRRRRAEHPADLGLPARRCNAV